MSFSLKFYIQSVYCILIISLITCFLYFINYLIGNIRKYKYYLETCYKIPAPPILPLLGHLLDFIKAPSQSHYILRDLTRKYYPIYRLHFSYYITVNLVHPDDVEQLLCNIKHSKKSKVYDLFKAWLREGLFTSSGPKWQARRKLLTPAFHFSILREFIGIFNKKTDHMIQALLKSEGRDINIEPLIAEVTLKAIMESAMGTNSLDTKVMEAYKEAFMSMGQIYLERIIRPWLYPQWLYKFSSIAREEARVVKTLHNLSMNIITERERTFDLAAVKASLEEDDNSSEKKRKLAMLDLLLLAKLEHNSIDDLGIKEEVDTFLAAGHDTSLTTLALLLMLIANHKEIQDRIYEEIIEVLGENQEHPNFNNLQNMVYMDRCIKEGLRLYPTARFISRETGEEYTTKTGYVIPKGMIVLIHFYDMHRLPEFWPDPEKFDPDRFLPENCKGRHPFAYLPFSAGPRNCIGQKYAVLDLKAAVCGVVRKFVLEPVDTPDTIVFPPDILLKTIGGVKVRFKKR